MKLLQKENDLSFFIDEGFQYSYLKPINEYVNMKLENNKWDDYNELYHAAKFFETIKNDKNLWLHSHLLFHEQKHIGSLFIVGGELNRIEKRFNIINENESLLLKYFHVIEKNKGYGNLWLTQIILPHYKANNYKKIYVNSSHQQSFPFYQRFGSEITTYQQDSDNKLFNRIGKTFLIEI